MRLERINKRKSKRRSENLKVLGYIRVSAISQKDNTSLEDQEQKIMEFCKLNDYELVEIFRDIESGAERSRRGYQTMLAMLEESGFDGVVSSKIDRLYRSLQAMADLFTVIDEKGKFIHTVDGVHSRNGYGQFMAKILGLVAEMERKHIKERVRGGRIANFQKYGKQGGNGKGVTGKAPFGYYWQDGVLMIDEGKAAIVKRIFKKRNKGSSLCKIAADLDGSGIRTNRGKSFSPQSIKNILENRYYVGEAIYSDWKQKEHHPAIVSTRLFNQIKRGSARGIA